jgi:hypothetical protein
MQHIGTSESVLPISGDGNHIIPIINRPEHVLTHTALDLAPVHYTKAGNAYHVQLFSLVLMLDYKGTHSPAFATATDDAYAFILGSPGQVGSQVALAKAVGN